MIQVNTLVKNFEGFRALDGVNMQVKKGNIYGLVGPNGAGKSTLIRHLTGVYRQDEGEVLIDGYNIEDIEGKYAHIVGNGSVDKRSNAHTLDWNGNAVYAGKVTVGTAPTADMDVATKQYVDNAVANAGGSGGSGSAADYGPYSIQYNSENNRLECIYTPTN